MADRTSEITAEVDALVRVHDQWEADPEAPDYPTAAFEQAIERLREVCDNGMIPQVCLGLVTAVAKLQLEWDLYAEGVGIQGEKPRSAFWGAFRQVLEERKGAKPFKPRPIESVKSLLDRDLKDFPGAHRQVMMIYGGERGPFAGSNGEPDSAKIEQEYNEPGSVIGDEWVHPDDADRLRRFEEETERRLTAVEMAEDGRDYDDPASAEDLLREGQYPATVARVKNMDLADVIKLTEKLQAEGVTINEMPNVAAERAPHEPEIRPEADRALQPAQPVVEDAERPEPHGAGGKDLEAVILKVHEQMPHGSPSEVLAAVRDKLGDPAAGSVQKVAAVLRKERESAPDAT